MRQRHVTAESLPDRIRPFLSMRPSAPGRKSTADPDLWHAKPHRKGGATQSGQASAGSPARTRASAFPAAALPQPTRLDRQARWQPQRCPPRDRPGTLPCLPIVGDPGEPSAQLNGSRKLAITVECSADRRRVFLGHSKHLRQVNYRWQPHREPIKTVADARV